MTDPTKMNVKQWLMMIIYPMIPTAQKWKVMTQLIKNMLKIKDRLECSKKDLILKIESNIIIIMMKCGSIENWWYKKIICEIFY